VTDKIQKVRIHSAAIAGLGDAAAIEMASQR
jgi:hypothetical protein